MADKTLSSLVGGGGGALPQLAPDLDFPGSTATDGRTAYKTVVVDAVGALTTALSLSGKFEVNTLNFSSLTAESITVKLTVDGVVIWDNTFVCGIDLYLIGGITSASFQDSKERYYCNESLLLEIQTTTDNVVQLTYMARPIL